MDLAKEERRFAGHHYSALHRAGEQEFLLHIVVADIPPPIASNSGRNCRSASGLVAPSRSMRLMLGSGNPLSPHFVIPRRERSEAEGICCGLPGRLFSAS